MNEGLRNAADRVLGNPLLSRIAEALTRNRLRILAYHGVEDSENFAKQMEYLVRHFVPVSSDQVIAAFHGEDLLPPKAVWVTFDDGHPSVVEHALPVLEKLGISATLFVCPGLIDTREPFWWQLVEKGLDQGFELQGDGETYAGSRVVDAIRWLKLINDEWRRDVISDLRSRIEAEGVTVTASQMTSRQLHQFLDAGGTVGNHTWDHPCLPNCASGAQESQVVQSHASLLAILGEPPVLFAYPNGDWTSNVVTVIGNLGYRLGVLFDHRMAVIDQPRFLVSRLRVDSRVSTPRFRAVLSGVHAGIYLARTTITGRAKPGQAVSL